MSGETEHNVSGWTTDTLKAQMDMRLSYEDKIRQLDERYYEERDRRYAEVAVEKEKALKIKEVADLAALELARQIQTYKDEKANELRSQLERERTTYVSQPELRGAVGELKAIISPIVEWVSKQQGAQANHQQDRDNGATRLTAVIGLAVASTGFLTTAIAGIALFATGHIR